MREARLCLAACRFGARPRIGALFAVVSRLGDGVFWYGLMLALALTGGTHGRIAALHMLLTGLVAWALYRLIKRSTRRKRPFQACPGVVARVPALDEFSFPSGHTLHAVSFSLIAVAYFSWMTWPLLLFTVLVAMSRVILGLHYPSDVLVATGLGALLAEGSLWLVPAGYA